jgi:hypothetical protein
MASGVILGNWTHRRGDAGGTRALAADVLGAKPRVAWSWTPPQGGRVDQVRIAGEHVFVATLGPVDPIAPGWEHSVVYAIDAARGKVVAQRTLADPVPVAAMVVEAGTLHLVATRPGEPVFWYRLACPDLVPIDRRKVDLERDPRQADVLDAWASPDGGLWLEIEVAPEARRAFAFVAADPTGPPARTLVIDGAARPVSPDAVTPPRDACVSGRSIFIPAYGDGELPSLCRLDPDGADVSPWVRADVSGAGAMLHAVAAEGAVSALAVARDGGRVLLQVVVLDRTSGVVRARSRPEEIARAELDTGARIARRAGGELVMQRVGADGAPCSDVVSASPDGSIASFRLGARPHVLDLVLGDAIVAHRKPKEGRVLVSAFAIVHEKGWLGPRATSPWSIELPSHGGGSTLYAGAGHVIVRGSRGLTAIRV